jgi:cell division protein FtsB
MSRKPGRLPPLLLTAVLAGSAVLFAGVFPFRQILASNRAVEVAEGKLEALEAETLVLEGRIAALQTNQEVERLAREQFGLVMPGEIGYVVVVPPWDDKPPGRSGPDAEPEAASSRPWWQGVWDFLTGRDLVGDG